jgi:hypothetical protein
MSWSTDRRSESLAGVLPTRPPVSGFAVEEQAGFGKALDDKLAGVVRATDRRNGESAGPLIRQPVLHGDGADCHDEVLWTAIPSRRRST